MKFGHFSQFESKMFHFFSLRRLCRCSSFTSFAVGWRYSYTRGAIAISEEKGPNLYVKFAVRVSLHLNIGLKKILDGRLGIYSATH